MHVEVGNPYSCDSESFSVPLCCEDVLEQASLSPYSYTQLWKYIMKKVSGPAGGQQNTLLSNLQFIIITSFKDEVATVKIKFRVSDAS